MAFNSFQFIIFFPVVTVLYYLIPKKIRYIWLLVCSYYFYMSWNAMYALLLLYSTLVTYVFGLLIGNIGKKDGKAAGFGKGVFLFLCVVLNLAVLFFFKYYNFVFDTINQILSFRSAGQLVVPRFDVILPVGISFYTFQALGYTIDVYRGDTYAEKNFFRYALFVSFFPQLVAGPIERSKSLLKQLAIPQKFQFVNFREGVLLMIWGYFLKMVIADRISIFVDTVYGNYKTYTGWYLIVATMLFAVQIYCDFGGYSIIAMGAAKILGIHLMDNFNAPYLSRSCAELWRRWHISLSTWFRDYLYIPLGGSRRGVFFKYLNQMIVFLVSGLWHGAALTYVIWGFLNGLYQVLGAILKPFRSLVVRVLPINTESLSHRLLQTFITFSLMDFSWIFFRADSLESAVNIIGSVFSARNYWILFDGSLYTCGLNRQNFNLLLLCIALLLIADICKYNGIVLRDEICRQDCWLRWIIISFSIGAVLLFGIWGPVYDEASFIYFQF